MGEDSKGSPIIILLLDKAIASRAVLGIVSGSDGRVSELKRFWSQLNNSERPRDRPYVPIGN